jgi:protein gp37
MFRDKKRFGQDPSTVIRSSERTFNTPRHWHGGGRCFVCSWSDFFIEEADKWRDEAWDVMAENKDLTFMILTKRPERINRDTLPKDWGNGYENVWMGVTAENQEMFDKRVPILAEVPAICRFVSVEPMLGPIKMGKRNRHLLDWVICGCESGPEARVTDTVWVQDLLTQCRDANIPFFLKQMRNIFQGRMGGPLIAGTELIKMPEFMGRVWDQVPTECQHHESGCQI